MAPARKGNYRVAVRPALVTVAAIAGLFAGCSVGGEVSRELGARCDTKEECDERCLPPAEGFPGGFCTLSCTGAGQCPSRASCADTEGGVCLFNCVEDSDCAFLGAGWGCRSMPSPSEETVSVCAGTE